MGELNREGIVREKKKVLNLYWKMEWLRKLLSRIYIKFNWYNDDNPNYLKRVIWSFICGYSLQDAFYYDYRTPKWVKKFINWMKRYVEV